MKAVLMSLTLLLLAVPTWVEADHSYRLNSHDRPLIGVAGHASGHVSLPLYYQRHGHRIERRTAPPSRDHLAAWYARTAVAQSHKAWRYGCARSHPRWSTSYQEHYRWALRQNVARVEREIERRDRTLASCLAW